MKDRMYFAQVTYTRKGAAWRSLLFFLAVSKEEAEQAIEALLPQAFSGAENIRVLGEPLVCQHYYNVTWEDDKIDALVQPLFAKIRLKA